ncbi:MAG: glycosyltransferase family 2 protein [Aristaeellaceae bacterium]
MPKPLVSVIVPVYNGEKFLGPCLESILRQDLADMEILVVDDGSRDGTWALLEDFARRDARIRPIRKENGGVSSARNAALAVCQGAYIRFVDADDLLPPDSMATLLEGMREKDCGLVIAAYTEVTGSRRDYRCLAPEDAAVDQEEFLRLFSRYANSFFYGVLWNKLFLGDVVREHQLRFPEGMNWGEDFVFVAGYLAHVRRVAFRTRPVYDYHRSLTGMVARQFMDCARHPLYNIRLRLAMYRSYRELYRQTGQYARYRRTLWLYLFRFTLHN